MKTWLILLAVVAGTLPATAPAQGLEDNTDHQRFACLQRERELEPLSDKTPDKRNTGFLRFKLRFEHPEQPPRVEVLQGRADEDMEELARRYLAGYRLPCLHHKEHPVEVVQEFSFARWGHEPPVVLPGKRPAPKVDIPKEGVHIPSFMGFEYGKALVELRFFEGKPEPEVRFVFSGVGVRMQSAIEDHVRQYRLVDPAGRPYPVTMMQPFAFVDPDTRGTKFRLTKDDFNLVEFLRLVGNLVEHPVDLDLNTMDCPFAVRVNLRQPYERNGVYQIESANPNRAYLLDWLAKLTPRYKNQAQQKDLFGTDVRITIPCGRLNLRDLARPAAPAASAP